MYGADECTVNDMRGALWGAREGCHRGGTWGGGVGGGWGSCVEFKYAGLMCTLSYLSLVVRHFGCFARYPLLDCLVFRQMQFEIVTAASILVVAHTARGVDRAAPHCVGDRWSARA